MVPNQAVASTISAHSIISSLFSCLPMQLNSKHAVVFWPHPVKALVNTKVYCHLVSKTVPMASAIFSFYNFLWGSYYLCNSGRGVHLRQVSYWWNLEGWTVALNNLSICTKTFRVVFVSAWNIRFPSVFDSFLLLYLVQHLNCYILNISAVLPLKLEAKIQRFHHKNYCFMYVNRSRIRHSLHLFQKSRRRRWLVVNGRGVVNQTTPVTTTTTNMRGTMTVWTTNMPAGTQTTAGEALLWTSSSGLCTEQYLLS